MREPSPEPHAVHADPTVVVLDTVQQVVCELHPQDARAVSPPWTVRWSATWAWTAWDGRSSSRAWSVPVASVSGAPPGDGRHCPRSAAGRAGTASASPLGLPEVRRTMPDVAAAPPQHAGTLVEVLEWHVRTHPHRLHITLSDTAEEITYAALYAGAQAVALGLQARDLPPEPHGGHHAAHRSSLL